MTLSLLVAVGFITKSHADAPWDAVCGDELTQSIFANPQGDFSRHKIAVIDNGFAEEHPLLRSHLDEGWNGRDLNGNIEASIVADPKHHENGKTASHGTHVAGIIAQMTPHVDIVPCKRGASGNRSVYSDKASLEYLLTRDDVKIVNLSFGIDWDHLSDPIEKLAKQGKLVVIAAGNSGKTLHGEKLAKFLKKPELGGRVVLVGATEKENGREQLTSFSNKPSKIFESIFIAAPGKKINSSVPYDRNGTGMKECDGTSMAAPVFAAAVARLMTEFNASVDEVRQVLFDTAVKESSEKHQTTHTGQGIMDFVAARNEFKKRAAEKLSAPATIVAEPLVEPLKPSAALNEQIFSIFQPLVEPKVVANPVAKIFIGDAKPIIQLVNRKVIEQEMPIQVQPAQVQQQTQGWYNYGKQVLDKAVSVGTAAAEILYNKVVSVAKSTYSYLRSWY